MTNKPSLGDSSEDLTTNKPVAEVKRPSLNKPLSAVKRPSLNKPLSQVIADGPSADKYESILLAAIRVFAQNGFFNSKVADVAKDAGVADGTVYLYFKNKEDLLTSIFNYTIDEAIETARKELAETTNPEQQIRKLAHLHLKLMGRDENLAKVFQVELRQLKFMEQFSTTKLSVYFELIRTAIAEGQNSGSFNSRINPQIAAKVLYGALDEMVTNWILTNKEYTLSEMADPVVDIFLNGVKQ